MQVHVNDAMAKGAEALIGVGPTTISSSPPSLSDCTVSDKGQAMCFSFTLSCQVAIVCMSNVTDFEWTPPSYVKHHSLGCIDGHCAQLNLVHLFLPIREFHLLRSSNTRLGTAALSCLVILPVAADKWFGVW